MSYLAAKYICRAPLLRQQACVVYSFGSNGQVSFEEEMIRRTGCEVHVFDPTMDELSIQTVEAVPGEFPLPLPSSQAPW